MKNIALKLEFDGTEFSGWQIQDNRRTVQGVIEDVLSEILKEKVKVTGCSRTDAGVHSRGYVLNFHSNTTIPAEKIMFPLNIILPEDVKVLQSQEVNDKFHARESALSKIYSYSFLNSSVEPVIHRRTLSLEKGKLDIELMEEAARLFIGTHDFKGFMSQGSSVKSTVRTIYNSKIESHDGTITYIVEGNGFLYNMVRIMVGTLIFIGQGTRTIEDLLSALNTGDRLKAGKVAQAKGLILNEVKY